MAEVPVLDGARAQALPEAALAPVAPLLLRGLVSGWPAVQAGRQGPAAMLAYLRGFTGEASVNAVRLAARHRGRVFYDESLAGFNFEALRMPLARVLDELEALAGTADPDTLYVGSSTLDACLPGFRAANPMQLDAGDALASLWLGNRSRVAAHFDVPDNLACCVAGERRVTLFPPEEVANLYPGPLDFTPAGQVVSMVDFHAPDPVRYPRFAQALANARQVTLSPGDALVIPSLWWHHVEAEGACSVLVNYWWRRVPAYMDPPGNVLDYALLALRDLPPEQRAGWRALFEHYVFGWQPENAAHLPAERRGALGPMDDNTARALRAKLAQKLRR